jgi:hypothetical protein
MSIDTATDTLSPVVAACAAAAGSMRFIPGNSPSSHFERWVLPTNDMVSLVQELVGAAIADAKSVSVVYERTLLIDSGAAPVGLPHLRNALYAELDARGVQPVHVQITSNFDRSIGTLVTFHLAGIQRTT